MRKVLDPALCWARAHAKAIAGAATAGISWAATTYELHVPAGWQAVVMVVVPYAVIHAIPNRVCGARGDSA